MLFRSSGTFTFREKKNKKKKQQEVFPFKSEILWRQRLIVLPPTTALSAAHRVPFIGHSPQLTFIPALQAERRLIFFPRHKVTLCHHNFERREKKHEVFFVFFYLENLVTVTLSVSGDVVLAGGEPADASQLFPQTNLHHHRDCVLSIHF